VLVEVLAVLMGLCLPIAFCLYITYTRWRPRSSRSDSLHAAVQVCRGCHVIHVRPSTSLSGPLSPYA
jgi:hypothetical protein